MEKTSPQKIKTWLQSEGRKIVWLAARVPINRNTMTLWLSGRQIPTAPARYRLRDITGIDVTDEAGWRIDND